jgi:signal transduction histidine kinase
MIIQTLLRDVTQERQREAGLRAYTAYVLRAQEEERQRISRELHDETIQTLALLVRRLDSVENTSGPLPSSAIEELHEARRIAEEVVNGLRDFARNLRPPILDDLGLLASIRRLLLDFTERTGVKGQLQLVGEERRLLPDAEVSTYRIAQEALWNVEQHSRATQVIVILTFKEYEARLEIRDNGIGFNVPSLRKGFPASDQLGLIGMQERAELLGGKLEIQSSPGKGTQVTASVPIEERIR